MKKIPNKSQYDMDKSELIEQLYNDIADRFEKETNWTREIVATSKDKAIDKAWTQFWAKLPFTHCGKAGLEAREI